MLINFWLIRTCIIAKTWPCAKHRHHQVRNYRTENTFPRLCKIFKKNLRHIEGGIKDGIKHWDLKQKLNYPFYGKKFFSTIFSWCLSNWSPAKGERFGDEKLLPTIMIAKAIKSSCNFFLIMKSNIFKNGKRTHGCGKPGGQYEVPECMALI